MPPRRVSSLLHPPPPRPPPPPPLLLPSCVADRPFVYRRPYLPDGVRLFGSEKGRRRSALQVIRLLS